MTTEGRSRARRSSRAVVSPAATWLADAAAVARFRRRWLGRAPVVLGPRDRAWRDLAPGLPAARALAASGVPYQIALERRYDRSGDPRHLAQALAAGATVFLPQIHQVLPRVARLMVALQAMVLGPRGEACSFLFLVEGRGREGMGLHHDGNVDAFWLQLAGRRTVTVGPRVPPKTPLDLDPRATSGAGAGWWTRDLDPGTLLYLPPRTPHRVVCRGPSLALSLTWRRLGRGRKAPGPPEWDVVSGRVDAAPPTRGNRLWTQVPVVAGAAVRTRRSFSLLTPDGAIELPRAALPLARRLAAMPWLAPAALRGSTRSLARLQDHGVLAPQDLPLRIVPDDPGALDGWRFAAPG